MLQFIFHAKRVFNFDIFKIFFVDSWKEKQIRISHETEASFEVVSNKQHCDHQHVDSSVYVCHFEGGCEGVSGFFLAQNSFGAAALDLELRCLCFSELGMQQRQPISPF